MFDPMTHADQTELLEGFLQSCPDAVVITDFDDVIHHWNVAAKKLFGYDADDVTGKRITEILERSTTKKTTVDRGGDPSGSDGSPEILRFSCHQICRADQRPVIVEQYSQRIPGGSPHWAIYFFRDVTDQRAYEARLAREANTDPLSGISNRRGFQVKLEDHLHEKLTLAIIDTDHFKQINDRFGHATGDAGIQYLASQLVDSFPDAITIARLGGDEFGLVLPTTGQADVLAKFEAFRGRVEQGRFGEAQTMTVSIGVAISNVSGTTARELLTTADRAMYQAKQAGKNRIASKVINV